MSRSSTMRATAWSGRYHYLIPTDAALETDTDVYDEALPIDRVLVSIEPAKQFRLVLLDACRDNPLRSRCGATLPRARSAAGLPRLSRPAPTP